MSQHVETIQTFPNPLMCLIYPKVAIQPHIHAPNNPEPLNQLHQRGVLNFPHFGRHASWNFSPQNMWAFGAFRYMFRFPGAQKGSTVWVFLSCLKHIALVDPQIEKWLPSLGPPNNENYPPKHRFCGAKSRFLIKPYSQMVSWWGHKFGWQVWTWRCFDWCFWQEKWREKTHFGGKHR